ncbi:MAG: FtsB family cell division protein [Sphaerochaetaceae bacterium]
MARNYLALFIALYLFFVLLGPALVGNQGYWVNRSLQKSITLQQRTLDETSIQLRDLEIRKEQIWDEAHLLDEARNLGYVKKGEQVFYFEDQGTSTAQTASQTK